MILSTFLRNIDLWWKTNHLKDKIPPGYLQRLLKFNSGNIDELPKQIEPSHSGLIITKTDAQSLGINTLTRADLVKQNNVFNANQVTYFRKSRLIEDCMI